VLPESHATTPDGDTPPRAPQSDLSRRSVLRTAAGAGVAGLAASAIIGAAGPAFAATAGNAHRAGGRPRSDDAAGASGGQHASSDLVVHVRDAGAGEMDVFTGTSQVRLRDKDLAARLIRAIG
jgi:hypothetical protein